MHINFAKIDHPLQDTVTFSNLHHVNLIWKDRHYNLYIFAGIPDLPDDPMVFTAVLPGDIEGATREELLETLGEYTWYLSLEEAIPLWKDKT